MANETNNNQSVFVVTERYEWENDIPSSNVVGVYTTHEKAEKAMKTAYESEKKSWLESVVDEEDEIDTNIFDDACTLFNNINNIDFYIVEIYEKVIND